MNDNTRRQIQREITNLTEGLAGEAIELVLLRSQITRTEDRIIHKETRLRELRDEMKGQDQ